MKHKVGDVVTIRKDLTEMGVYYMDDGIYGNDCVDAMIAQGGKEFTIIDASDKGYEFEKYGWTWTDEMFEEEETE